MLKVLSICAALVLAAAAFSDSAEARNRGFSGVAAAVMFGWVAVAILAVPALAQWVVFAR